MGPQLKRVVKVNVDFEAQVIGQLVYAEIEEVDSVQTAVVKANVAHSYHVIRKAAQVVQQMAFFAGDQKVQAMKFTKPWVVGLLKRAALRRRRVTAQDKVLPPIADVRRRMSEIQEVAEKGNYTTAEIVNADETGVFFGAPPKNQYVPHSAARATAPESNEKARYTAMLWGKANGIMGSTLLIMKMSVKGADLSSSCVLDNLTWSN